VQWHERLVLKKWRSDFRNGVLFSVLAAGAAVMAGVLVPVM